MLLRLIVFPFVFLLASTLFFAHVPLRQSSFVVAYTGECNYQSGTCLKEMNSGHVVYWAGYDRYMNGWSGDMYHTVFVRDDHVYHYERERGQAQRLTTEDGVRRYAPTLSPDGKQLVYAAAATGTAVEVRVRDMDGEDELIIPATVSGSLRFSNTFSWSPDGRHIVYAATGTTVGYGNSYGALLHLLDVETGDTTPIGETGSYEVVWSPDGEHFAHVDSDTNTYTVIHAESGAAVGTEQAEPSRSTYNSYYYSSDAVFSPDGESLLYVERDYMDGVTRVKSRSVATGETTELTAIPGAETRFEDVVWQEDGILLMEDRINSRSADRIIFHHVDPETGERTEMGTLEAEDYSQVAGW